MDTYCPTYNKGIFENQRKSKGGRVDKIQISLKCFRKKMIIFFSCKLLNMKMYKIGFLLEIKRYGCEQYFFLFNFDDFFRHFFSCHCIISCNISSIIKVKSFLLFTFTDPDLLNGISIQQGQWIYTVCYSRVTYPDLHQCSLLDICHDRALFKRPYLSNPWVKIYDFTKYHR